MTASDPARPTFTILLPVHRPPSMLPYAIATVLSQTRQDFELLMICDGAPPETAACAQEFAARDPRIRALVHPKAEGRGEFLRDQALRSARGRYVCQISDDDLWFPNHLEEMAVLLGQAEFGNLLQIGILANGSKICSPGDLARKGVRRNMLKNGANFFGPTAAGYHLSTYFRLPQGWSPAPPGMASDLHMWCKFLSLPGIVCATRFSLTCLHPGTPLRTAMSEQERAEENRRLFEAVQDRAGREAILQEVMQHLVLRSQITHRCAYLLADMGGSAALAAELRDDDELLAELGRIDQQLSRGRPVRKRPPAVQRVLRWLRRSARRS